MLNKRNNFENMSVLNSPLFKMPHYFKLYAIQK